MAKKKGKPKKKKVTRKKKKAAPKKKAKKRAKKAKVKADYSAAELLAAVQKLEELTESVREVASQLIRTEELQADLLGNRMKQMKERDALESATNALTVSRNKLAGELAKVSKVSAALGGELDSLDKTIDKAENRAKDLSRRKDALTSEKKALTAMNAGMKAREKKLKSEISKLKSLKSGLIT
jgi:chromosome segregation ATPase